MRSRFGRRVQLRFSGRARSLHPGYLPPSWSLPLPQAHNVRLNPAARRARKACFVLQVPQWERQRQCGREGECQPHHWRQWVSGGQLFSGRSEEHTSELQSLMRISYAVFCLKKKINTHTSHKLILTYTMSTIYIQLYKSN